MHRNNHLNSEALLKIKRTTILAVFVILSFFLGRYSYFLESGSLVADLTAVTSNSYQQGYSEAMNDAEEALMDNGIARQEALSLSNATVKSATDQQIVVEFNASEIDILKEGLITKTITVPSGLMVEKYADRPMEEFQKEAEEFQKKFNELQNKGADFEEMQKLTMPTPYTIEKLNPGDLKPGDKISVQSKTDIRDSNSFEAVLIRLISQ